MSILRSVRHHLKTFFTQLPLTYRPRSAPPGPLRELLRAHNRGVLRHRGPVYRRLALIAGAIAWPLVLPFLAWRKWREKHRVIETISGRSAFGQAVDLLRLGWTQNAVPKDYYLFNWWDRSRTPAEYLPDGRVQQLLRLLYRDVDTRTLDDKLRFHFFARTHGLATAPVLARIDRNQVEYFTSQKVLRQDLFIKPRGGRRAIGVSRWLWDADAGGYRREIDAPLRTWEEVVERARAIASEGELLVQPVLRSHPAIIDLGNGALCTARIVTVIETDGEPAEFSSVANFPGGTSFISDNGVAAPIDPASGRLVVFLNTDPGYPQYKNHPVTGVLAESRVVPAWPEALALALRAHAQLREIPFIGWDVALTETGPQLLEGNHGIGLNTHQLAPYPPLGRTRFPEIVLHHLARKNTGANA